MKEIMDLLFKNGYESYVVGGFVRDYLLGISSKDIDICTNAPIDEIIRIFDGRGIAYKEYFSYHIVDSEYTYDITTFREEIKYDKNKPVEIKIANSLYQDLLRRDFTINTFAINHDGLFVDLLNAIRDLNNKLIKVVGNTEFKLNEDKTRIIRAIRFACSLDFDLDKEIIEFINKNKEVLSDGVPLEFKKKELDKIFESNGLYKFTYYVKRYDLFKVLNINFDNLVSTYDKYGVWAQIETELPFSKEEKKKISDIKSLVERKDIKLVDVKVYSDEVLLNAANILHLENKVKTYKEILKLHSVIDMDIDIEVFFDYVREEDIVKTYRLVEKRIMEGYLLNNSYDILEYLRNL